MNLMEKKAKQAQICYDALLKDTGVKLQEDVIFHVDKKRKRTMLKACFQHNPFPKARIVLCYLRLKAVVRLFKKETVVQTGPAAAVLAMNTALAGEIETLRMEQGEKSASRVKKAPIICDVAFAGLSVVRLYMMGYDGDQRFKEVRCNSGMRVNNALNGSFYKYQTKDGRFFSAHVYYESQKEKMMKALGMTMNPSELTMDTLKKDKVEVAEKMKQHDGLALEELSFESGACGCMLRDRKEWEESEVGKAVCEMPLFRLNKVADAPVKSYDGNLSKGPLTGVKVLDLTHIIAGPACTRVLAEMGADVLLVRRGRLKEQEQAMLELDGWAGKRCISLDFNRENELARVKELIQQADVVVSSYQNGTFDKFGLSKEEIHQINPNVIYASMVCFSDSVWMNRPGWAPLAEDITGLSVRNGSAKKPKNLNGVPLDYIPGFIMAAGVLKAIQKSMTEGGAYDVTASLTRTAYWLHECTDLCEKEQEEKFSSTVSCHGNYPNWDEVWKDIADTAVGNVKFPTPPVYREGQVNPIKNMKFVDEGVVGFRK